MFNRMNSNRFFIFILFIFTLTNVYCDTCTSYETHCFKYSSDWCCPDDYECGTYYKDCNPPSDISPTLITLCIVVPLFICVMCFSCCIRARQQQRLQAAMYRRNTNNIVRPYQQQSTHRPPSTTHIRSVHNVSSPPAYYPTYEESPPSYEVATSNLSSRHPSAPPPTGIATVEQIHSTV